MHRATILVGLSSVKLFCLVSYFLQDHRVEYHGTVNLIKLLFFNKYNGAFEFCEVFQPRLKFAIRSDPDKDTYMFFLGETF
jgi:hypothetical protein